MADEDLVSRAVAAFNARDVEGFVALTAPDFEWLPSMSPIEGAAFVGPEGIRSYFDGLGEAWEHFRIVPGEMRSHATGLLVLGRLDAQGRGSGARVDSPLGMAFDLHEGKVARIRGYLDRGEALRAVGLDE
jgi:ketosteroid isomerase-like protein